MTSVCIDGDNEFLNINEFLYINGDGDGRDGDGPEPPQTRRAPLREQQTQILDGELELEFEQPPTQILDVGIHSPRIQNIEVDGLPGVSMFFDDLPVRKQGLCEEKYVGMLQIVSNTIEKCLQLFKEACLCGFFQKEGLICSDVVPQHSGMQTEGLICSDVVPQHSGMQRGSVQTQTMGDSSRAMDLDDEHDMDVRAKIKSKYKMHLEKQSNMVNKFELDKFLVDDCEEDNDDFDILGWWKSNSTKYRISSLIARDVLAILVFIVASESAFSTGGRVLDPFRSSLSPITVEALICTQNWLRSPSQISLRDQLDELEDIESAARMSTSLIDVRKQ
ncbi:unnamed protein product [Camellia sinensis]